MEVKLSEDKTSSTFTLILTCFILHKLSRWEWLTWFSVRMKAYREFEEEKRHITMITYFLLGVIFFIISQLFQLRGKLKMTVASAAA